MKKLLTVVVFCLPVFGQTAYSGPGLYSGSAAYGVSSGAPTFYAALPQLWVDNNELTCPITSSCYAGSPGLSLTAPGYELVLGSSSWISGPPPGYCTFGLPYAATASGEQSAIADIEACRTSGIIHGTAIGIILDIPAGVYTSANGIVIPQTSGTLANAPLIIRSTYDSTLAAMPEPVCAGGIQDNLAVSVNPGLNNPDCTGTNMYYENGPQNASGVLTGLTTVSVNTTTLVAIATGGAQLVPLANGYVSPALALGPGQITIVDPSTCGTSTCSENVTPLSGINQVGLYATFANPHAAGVAVTYVPNAGVAGCTGSGTFQLANGTCKNIAQYNYLQSMAQVECSAKGCLPFQLCSPATGASIPCTGTIGPDHWQFEDLAVSLCPGPVSNCVGADTDQFLIETGQGSTGTALSFSQYAHDIHFRRIWAHADWTSLSTGTNAVADGIDLSGCYYCSVVGTQVSQALRPGAEGHSVLAQGNTIKLDNNWLEGLSSGVFAGGESSPPAWLGYISFTDVELRRYRDTFPYSWLGMMTIPNNNSRWPGASLVRKNCNEFKEGARIVFSGLICENVDNSGGQGGINFSDATRGISGQLHGAIGADYGAVSKDVTVQGTILRNSCNGFTDVGGRSGGSGSGVSWPQQRFSFANVLGYGITETNPGCPTGTGYGAKIDTGAQSWNVFITETGTTATATAFASIDAGVNFTSVANASGGTTVYTICNGTTQSCTSAEATANSALCGGPTGAYIYVYGFSNAGNNSTISGFPCTASSAWVSASTPLTITLTNSGGVTETPSNAASGNPILANTTASNNATAGYQVFDMLTSDPVYVTGCSNVTGFNMPTQTVGSHAGVAAGVGPPATAGSAAWTGTFSPAGVTVSYLWPSISTGSEDNSGTCILTNVQGSSQDLIWNHLTLITDATESVYPINTPSNGGPNFQVNHLFVNSIFLSNPTNGTGLAGWYNADTNTPHEGTNTEEFNYDITSMSTYSLVWPGRVAGMYTEYGNNANYPDSALSPCTPPNCSVTPPVTMYFPATSCGVGFVYSCAGNLPLTLPDYHQFALSSGSAYENAGADGTDIGVHVTAIDAAQTLDQYVCATSCGSPGPFPD